jgi:hypothetical protein
VGQAGGRRGRSTLSGDQEENSSVDISKIVSSLQGCSFHHKGGKFPSWREKLANKESLGI